MTTEIVTREVLEDLAKEGASIYDAVREIGVNEATLRSARKRHGINLRRLADLNYTDIIQNMTAIEAVEYLQNIIGELAPWLENDHDDDAVELGLRPLEARVFGILKMARGEFISRDNIYRAVYSDRVPGDELPDPKVIGTYICNLREKLRGSRYEIRTMHWYGYALFEARQGGKDDA